MIQNTGCGCPGGEGEAGCKSSSKSHLFVLFCVHMCGQVCHGGSIKVRGRLGGVGSLVLHGDGTQTVRYGSKYINLLSHLHSPRSLLKVWHVTLWKEKKTLKGI